MAISPDAKKNISAIGFAALGAGIAALMPIVLGHVPPIYQVAVMSVFGALAHRIDAWGHTDRVEAAIAAAGKVQS